MRGWSRLIWLALVVLAAACTSSEPESPTISGGEVRVGVLAPLSGDDKAVGTDAVRGAQLAAALVNGEEGEVSLAGVGADGLAGTKMAVVPGDTAGD
ncbi:MAG TPA: hypothetical protein VG409_11130, partial [Actinomycetota bacterium]|nr:hypothetical protein [Actinomycetota bacterium]